MPCTIIRPDVAEAFADPRLARPAGATAAWPGPAEQAAQPLTLEVQAVSGRDERAILYAGRALDEAAQALECPGHERHRKPASAGTGRRG